MSPSCTGSRRLCLADNRDLFDLGSKQVAKYVRQQVQRQQHNGGIQRVLKHAMRPLQTHRKQERHERQHAHEHDRNYAV